MKKRVLSALMAVGLACSLVVTAFATADVSATPAPTAAVESQNTETESSDPAAEADPAETLAETPAATQEPTPAPEESTPAPSEEPASSATPEPTAEPSAAPDDTVTATPTPTSEATTAPTPEATEEPAAAEPTAEPEATAEPAADNSADGVEYTAVLEQDGQALNVIVTAPADAFSEDVSLEVAAIEDTDETDAIAAELDESGVTYDGFAALDISFKNAAGEEVEPNAPVTVRIELPDSIVDSGIDLNTLAVQHLAEDADGNVTAVEQVASVADGSIALSEEAQAAMEAQAAENAADDTATTDEAAGVAPMMLAANNAQTEATAEAAAVAEFEVSGFSTFTITWSGYFRQQEFDVTCYDAGSGQPLPGSAKPSDFTVDDGTAIDLTKGAHDNRVNIDGYIFDHAEFRAGNSGNWQPLTSLKAEFNFTWSGGRWTYYCNNEQVGNKPTIRLYYTEIPDLSTIDTVDSAANGVRISLFDYHDDNEGVYNYIENKLGEFDWNGVNTGNWNYWVAGNGVFQGILENTISDETDLPVFNSGRGNDFSWLFSESTDKFNGSEARTYYGGLNHLFSQAEYDSTGYYEYDSSKNFATLEESGDFTVYNLPYKPGNTEAATPKFLPFNDLANDANTLAGDGKENYHFGLNVGFEFIQPESGMAEWNGEESAMRFEFTGDDDLWVFIDGVLVLDMGGVHDAQEGYIDFNTGEVWVSKVWDGDEKSQNLEDIFRAALGDTWVEDNMTDGRFNDYTAHTFELYYLERGKGGSNCRMRFNIQSVPAGTVAVNKQINSGASAEQKNATYQMQLFVQNEAGNFVTPAEAFSDYENNPFTIGNSLSETAQDVQLKGDGKFTVTGGNSVYIHNIPVNTVYKIKEINVASDTEAVLINNETATVTNGTAETNESFTVGRNNAVTVFNRFAVAPPDDFDITTGKRADLNEDGTYNLTLSTSGDIASVEGEQIKADILFVVDRSSSMWNDFRDYGRYETSKSRMDVLKEAIAGLVTEIEANDAIDANYNVVQFGTGTYNSKLLGDNGWTNVSSEISSVLSDIRETNYDNYPGVGTNYQAGIKLAKEELQYAREGAKTYVIFLTDGDPTYHYTESGGETGGGNYTTSADIENAVKEIQGLSCDNFYAIGVSDDYTKDNLDRLCGKSNVHPGSGVNATVAQVYGASEDGDLPEIFDSIISEMTFFAAENVVMHDTLSDWAEVADASNVQFAVKLEHRTYDLDNNEVWTEVDAVGEASKVVGSGGSVHYTTSTTDDEGEPTVTDVYIIPIYDSASKTITVYLADNANGNTVDNPSTYKLAPDYRYSVTVKIKPSEAAIDQGMTGADSKNTPDDGTGTHANENPKGMGFWSNVNESAKVTYTVGNVDREKEFPKPVIQVQETFGDLQLVKKVVDDNGTPISTPKVPGTDGEMDDATYSFVITAAGDLAKKVVANTDGYVISGSEQKVKFNSSGAEGATATVTVAPGDTGVTIKDLPTGPYTVTEDSPAAEVTSDNQTYYYASNDVGNGKQATVNKDETEMVTITNTYKPYRTVTITKQVDGDMGDTKNPFNFTTSVSRGDDNKVKISGTQGDSQDKVFELGSDTISTKFTEAQLGTDEEKSAVFTTTGYTLADGESITISKLKDDDTLTLAESEANQGGYETSYIVGDVTQTSWSGDVIVNGDMTITVTNTRKVVAPTGLESNHTTPYGLMVGAAGVAGAALVGSVVVRRRRRRQE